MQEFDIKSKVGRIYQISSTIPYTEANNISENYTLIQTNGPPIPKSIKCTSVYKLRNILSEQSNMIIHIYSISSFCVDEEVNSWFRLAVSRGCSLYLYTFQSYKAWFADEILNDPI